MARSTTNPKKETTKTMSAALSAVPAPSAPSALAALEAELNAAFAERRDIIRAVLIAALAKENSFMLGPPGTAKSMLARVMSKAFNASYFEYLMTRFTEPSELFGPVDPTAFRAGKYARVTANKFPEAEVVFLDEVWKSNSAIANALLTGLNEKTYDAGSGPMKLPLLTCIGASNELPESSELDAIYDRFLVRVVTDYIEEDSNFEALLTSVATGNVTKVTAKVDLRAEQAAAAAVTVSKDTIDALVALRAACKKAGMTVSDRRWVQCLSVVRAAAHLDGRTVTEPDDLEVLENVLWKKPDERPAVTRTIQTTVNPAGAVAVEQLDAAKDLFAKLPNRSTTAKDAYLAALGGASEDLDRMLTKVTGLPPGRKVDAAKTEIAAMKQEVAKLAMRAAGFDL